MKFYYVYVLKSMKDYKNYVGYTEDLKLRFEQHNKGLVKSTKDRRPLILIYYKACLNQQDATHREKYLKTYLGKMFILKSMKDYKNYVGYTEDLKLRFEQHNKGLVKSTKNRRPLILIYYEACLNQQDATHREKYLKTHHGKMFIKNRLKSYLTG